MITKTDVLAIASELSWVGDPEWTSLIAYAYRQLAPAPWGIFLDDGATYLVAHLATMSGRRGAGGPVQSESVGQVSRSYGMMAMPTALGTTSYGQEFARLRNGLHDARFPVIA